MDEAPCKRSFDGTPKPTSSYYSNLEELRSYDDDSDSYSDSDSEPTSSFHCGDLMECDCSECMIDSSIIESDATSDSSDSHTSEIIWILDEEESNNLENSPVSFLKSINLSLGNQRQSRLSTVFRNLCLNELKGAILRLNGDSRFYLAQKHLKTNSTINHIIPDLVFCVISLLKDDSRDKLQETVLLLHSVYSILHSDELPTDCVRDLMDALMFNLIDPASRCNFGSHCYLLKDIIADIILTLFDKYHAAELWNEAKTKLGNAFRYASTFVVQYGAIVLSLSIEDFIKELSSNLEAYSNHTFYEALNNAPSRQGALNVRNKLLLLFKHWVKYWLSSTSLDYDLSMNMQFITDPKLCIADFFHYFCKDELVHYCIFPAKYMDRRMPRKTNTNPFSSLSYLMIPSKKKLDSSLKNTSKNFPSYDTQSPEFQDKFSDQDEDEKEESFMSPWSNKVNLEVITLSERYVSHVPFEKFKPSVLSEETTGSEENTSVPSQENALVLIEENSPALSEETGDISEEIENVSSVKLKFASVNLKYIPFKLPVCVETRNICSRENGDTFSSNETLFVSK